MPESQQKKKATQILKSMYSSTSFRALSKLDSLSQRLAELEDTVEDALEREGGELESLAGETAKLAEAWQHETEQNQVKREDLLRTRKQVLCRLKKAIQISSRQRKQSEVRVLEYLDERLRCLSQRVDATLRQKSPAYLSLQQALEGLPALEGQLHERRRGREQEDRLVEGRAEERESLLEEQLTEVRECRAKREKSLAEMQEELRLRVRSQLKQQQLSREATHDQLLLLIERAMPKLQCNFI